MARSVAPSSSEDSLQAAFDLSNAFVQTLVDSQRVPLQMMFAWQRSVAEAQQAVWDGWAAHFAGGVPIDA